MLCCAVLCCEEKTVLRPKFGKGVIGAYHPKSMVLVWEGKMDLIMNYSEPEWRTLSVLSEEDRSGEVRDRVEPPSCIDRACHSLLADRWRSARCLSWLTRSLG